MRKRASRSKSVRISLPARFKIVPVRAPKKTRSKARALINGGPNPCPVGCTCQGSVQFDGIWYWVCIGADGTTTYIRKP